MDRFAKINIQLFNYSDSQILVLENSGALIEMEKAIANNLTSPPDSDVLFDVGTQILVEQKGAGQTSIVAGAGVTILSSGSKLKLTGQYSVVTLIKKAANVWLLAGDISA